MIGAVGNNAEGIAGANWQVDLLIVQVCHRNRNCSVANEVNGLEYAIQHGVKVLNMSFGGAWGG